MSIHEKHVQSKKSEFKKLLLGLLIFAAIGISSAIYHGIKDSKNNESIKLAEPSK
jgi:hypothetical protein